MAAKYDIARPAPLRKPLLLGCKEDHQFVAADRDISKGDEPVIVTHFVYPPIPILSPSSVGYFACAEDAIHALREKVDGWIVRAEGEDAEPCTEAARKAGCTCGMSSVNSASIDPPEPRVDRDCPLHGRSDPDAERQRRMDERIAR